MISVFCKTYQYNLKILEIHSAPVDSTDIMFINGSWEEVERFVLEIGKEQSMTVREELRKDTLGFGVR